jgi:hypothetical protein
MALIFKINRIDASIDPGRQFGTGCREASDRIDASIDPGRLFGTGCRGAKRQVHVSVQRRGATMFNQALEPLRETISN